MDVTLEEAKELIPERVNPGTKSTMRCCIHKEHAILEERIAIIMGGEQSNPNIIQVIDIAYDQCPVNLLGFSI